MRLVIIARHILYVMLGYFISRGNVVEVIAINIILIMTCQDESR